MDLVRAQSQAQSGRITVPGLPGLDDQLRARLQAMVLNSVDGALIAAVDQFVLACASQAVQQRLASLPPDIQQQVSSLFDLEGIRHAVVNLVDARVDQLLTAMSATSTPAAAVPDQDEEALRRARQDVRGPAEGARAVRFGGSTQRDDAERG